jgi:hypothetical protein
MAKTKQQAFQFGSNNRSVGADVMRHRAVKRPNWAPLVKHRSENHDIRGYGTRSIKTPKRNIARLHWHKNCGLAERNGNQIIWPRVIVTEAIHCVVSKVARTRAGARFSRSIARIRVTGHGPHARRSTARDKQGFLAGVIAFESARRAVKATAMTERPRRCSLRLFLEL